MPMAQEIVQILIEAEDKASKELRGVSSAMADVAKPASGLSSVLGGVGKVAAGLTFGVAVAGVGALGAALVSGIGDARDAAQVMAQTQNVIKSTGGAAGFTADQIADMASSLSAASGKSLFGDDDIQRGQNMLLTFTNITDKLPDTTKVMLDMAQALGTDAGGAAVQLGKALNDPIQGISALSRVGVSFTDQQKEQIKTMQEAGDMAGAQTVILNELNKEFGGSAEAAAKADGGMAQFRDSLGEAAEKVGAALLPAMGQLGALLSSPAVLGALDAVATALGTGLSTAIAWLVDTGIPGMVTAWQTVSAVVGPFIALLTTTLAPILATISTTLGQFATDIAPKVSAAWTNISAIITAVMETITTYIDGHMATIQQIFSGVWTAIKGIVEVAWGLISGVITVGLDVLAGDWSGAWTDMQTAAGTIWEGIKLAFSGYVEFIKGLFTLAWEPVQRAWDSVWNGLQASASGIWKTISGDFTTAIAGIKGLLSGGWEAATAAWSSLWATVEAAITAPMQRAQDFVKGAVENILGFIIHAIDRIQALIDWIGKIPSIHVPTPSVPPSGGGGGGGSGIQSAPSFASGIANFAGGLAYVHRGELLMNLPPGTSVIPAGAQRGIYNITIHAPNGQPQTIADTLVSTLRSRGVR